MPKPNEGQESQESQDQSQDTAQDQGIAFDFPLDRDPKEKKSSKDDQSEEETVETTEPEETDTDSETSEEPAAEEEEQSEQEEADEQDISEDELNKFSPKAKGLYFALKKEREARQEAEKERDFLRLQSKFGKKPDDEEVGTSEQEQEESGSEETDPVGYLFEGKEADDFVSVAEVKSAVTKMFQSLKDAEAKKEQTAAKQQEKAAKMHSDLIEKANAVDKHMRSTIKDYSEAVHYAGKLMTQFPGLQAEFTHIARTKGAESAAQYAYNLGKQHREFGSGKYGKPKDAAAKSRQDARSAISNLRKPQTSVNSGPGKRTAEKYSAEELEDMDATELGSALAGMGMNEFRKVPKRLRDKALAASQ